MSAQPPFTFGEHPATDDGTALRVVIPVGITSTESLFDALEEGLRFPGYFGRNWNALSDCLRDFHWAPERRIVLVHRELPKLSDDELAIYVDVLAHAVEDWRHDAQHESHELEVVFPAASELPVRRLLASRQG